MVPVISPPPPSLAASPPADPTAVVGRRIVAYIIDLVLYLGIAIGVLAAVSSSENLGSAFEAEAICDILNNSDDFDSLCINSDSTIILIEPGDFLTVILVSAAFALVTQLILPTLTGFTPGKAIVGLRIVNQDTFERAGFGANLGRLVLWIVDGIPFCFPLVGLVTGLSSSGHRRVGDMAANTVVVDKLWIGTPLPVPGVTATAPGLVQPPGMQASTIGVSPPPPGGAAPPVSPSGPPVAPPVTPAGPPIAPPAPSAPAPPADAPPPPFADAPPPPTPAPPPPTATPPPPAATPPPPVVPPSPVQPPPPVADIPEPITEPTPISEPEPVAEPAPFTAPEPPAADDTVVIQPPATPPPAEPAAPPPAPAPEPEPVAATQPGVDAPQWDAARDTYIQWDPDLNEWMEWSEAAGAWIPISR